MHLKPPWTLCALWEKILPSVKERTPQRFVCVTSHSEGGFYFSQKNTEEQNTQSFTETLSHPITQNLTATFSYNVLWYLYAEGLLWVRNGAQKGSVKSVGSVREKIPQHERKNSPTCEKDVIKIGELICLVVSWVILYLHKKHLQSAASWLFINDGNIGKKVEYNQHVFRWLWVWNEEMRFLHQEEAFLASRRACSRMLKGLSSNVEGHGLWGRETKNVYMFGACGKRGQRDACGRKGGGRRGKIISSRQGEEDVKSGWVWKLLVKTS